jgi:deferrochelatase/peroxidase EfeB
MVSMSGERGLVSRRVALACGAAVVAASAGFAVASGGSRPPAPVRATSEGPHQPGIVTPSKAVLAAYDVTGTGRQALTALFRDLSARVARTRAEVTVAVGASLFDDRFALAHVRPRRLTEMPAFPHDVLDPAQCHGDLLLQVCSDDDPTAVLAALAPSAATPRWLADGFRQENGTTAAGLPVDRNPFGFRDGAGNPDPGDRPRINELVWVVGGEGEPGWATGGTYQVVRVIRLATELWDAEPVPVQETVFGRRKSDGAPLGGEREDDRIEYSRDPDGQVIALDSHIRRANPRTPEAMGNQILRRGYSYRRTQDGITDDGVLFVCFQHDVERGFATIQRRLTGQLLDRYTLTVGGGYFFVLPGLTTGDGDFLGRSLVTAG